MGIGIDDHGFVSPVVSLNAAPAQRIDSFLFQYLSQPGDERAVQGEKLFDIIFQSRAVERS
jgi:hypothetical protein